MIAQVSPPVGIPAWLWIAATVVAAAGGWYLLRAQRRSLDAHSSADQTTAFTGLVEKGASQLIADLRTDLERLRGDLDRARAAEDILERRVNDLETALVAAERNLRHAQARIGVLEAFLTAQGFDPAVVNGDT